MPIKMVSLFRTNTPSLALKVKYCDTFLSKSLGLMFTKQLDTDRGILLVNSHASRINSAIHMLFMNYDLSVFWLDHDLIIVDKVFAKRWRLSYFPKFPSQYVLELHPEVFSDFNLGDQFIMAT